MADALHWETEYRARSGNREYHITKWGDSWRLQWLRAGDFRGVDVFGALRDAKAAAEDQEAGNG